MCAKQLFIAVDRIDGDQRARAVFSRGGPGGTRELVGICIFHAGGSSARPDRQLSGKEGRKGENAVEDRRGGVSSQSRERAVDLCVIGDISGTVSERERFLRLTRRRCFCRAKLRLASISTEPSGQWRRNRRFSEPGPRAPAGPEWGRKKFRQENSRPTSAKLTTDYKVR